MAPQDKKYQVDVPSGESLTSDDAELIAMGYQAFSIMGMCSSIATTFNTPLTLGGPASVSLSKSPTMCFTLGASIAEIVSAFPTAGGLYTASAPRSSETTCHRRMGCRLVSGSQIALTWAEFPYDVISRLNMLGQVAGVSSTEFGLSNMIWGATSFTHPNSGLELIRTYHHEMLPSPLSGLHPLYGFILPLTLRLRLASLNRTPRLPYLEYSIQNSLATKYLARMTSGFVFVNIGATLRGISSYVFGSAGVVNQTGGWNTGIAFLFGLLSVQWTMTDYDATAHISEEVQRAAVAAPAAIFIAVVGTGLLGWLFNIVLVLCSGPLEDLPGPSGLAVLEIMYRRIGRAGALFLWVWVCLTAFFVVQTALQACSRTFYAFSRDRGLPDKGIFGRITKNHVPLYAVVSLEDKVRPKVHILPGLLDLASPIAAQAIFALTAMALDLSYIVPIACRRIFRNHPEVHFKPGPFYMGDGFLGWAVNIMCILWTLFVAVILALPTIIPVTQLNMNYASVITVGVMVCSLAWYFAGARKHYHGPTSRFTRSLCLEAVLTVHLQAILDPITNQARGTVAKTSLLTTIFRIKAR
ncbi:amino acid permease [Rhizoctonia solani AG-1 IA]|uniref:Amino acid permease n=1 Tax=Thanatephorus cucumeris (strain AG1-IA) TaxID=983506 RepID=L8WVH3_THACA|nr:amino acid permease [Rhizoctonia solani AG-1 IA]